MELKSLDPSHPKLTPDEISKSQIFEVETMGYWVAGVIYSLLFLYWVLATILILTSDMTTLFILNSVILTLIVHILCIIARRVLMRFIFCTPKGIFISDLNGFTMAYIPRKCRSHSKGNYVNFTSTMPGLFNLKIYKSGKLIEEAFVSTNEIDVINLSECMHNSMYEDPPKQEVLLDVKIN